MDKYLKIIIKKQCKIVGVDYDKINFKKKDWFHDYEWTDKQEKKFSDWLIDYMKNNKEARYNLMRVPSVNKVFLEKFARSFILMYGWKTKKGGE